MTAVFRFAPSPNGQLHLGHAYSALMNLQLARQLNGKILLRIEDIDQTRCTPDLEKQMLKDLEWIGFEWDESPLRQSDRFHIYQEALTTLNMKQLIYPAILSRSEIKNKVKKMELCGSPWPRDPDGSPLYPGDERQLSPATQQEIMASKQPYSLRLNIVAAQKLHNTVISWREFFPKPYDVKAKPEEWGDVILARKDAPVSYHLCSVLDDAEQNITHIVRGKDLFHSTSVHRLLQSLLKLPEPQYYHHKLILDENDKKLSKSIESTSLSALRSSGHKKEDIEEMLFADDCG